MSVAFYNKPMLTYFYTITLIYFKMYDQFFDILTLLRGPILLLGHRGPVRPVGVAYN